MSNDPGKPDFSNVQAGSASTANKPADKPADFSNVNAGVTSTAAAKPTERIYTVASGDSLSKIAKEFYGNASRWPEIFEANRDQLSNPDLIKPGQVLRIPLDRTPDDSADDLSSD